MKEPDFLTKAYIEGLLDGRDKTGGHITKERLLKGEKAFSLEQERKNLIRSLKDLKHELGQEEMLDNTDREHFKQGYNKAIEDVIKLFS